MHYQQCKLTNRKTEPLRRQKWIMLQSCLLCGGRDAPDLGRTDSLQLKNLCKNDIYTWTHCQSQRTHVIVKTEQLFNWKESSVCNRLLNHRIAKLHSAKMLTVKRPSMGNDCMSVHEISSTLFTNCSCHISCEKCHANLSCGGVCYTVVLSLL